MKLTKKSDIRAFLDLVNAGAPAKAYRNLGILRHQISYHVGLIAEYEKVLAEPEPVKESVKKVEAEKPKPKKATGWLPGSVTKVDLEVKEDDNEEES